MQNSYPRQNDFCRGFFITFFGQLYFNFKETQYKKGWKTDGKKEIKDI